MTINPTDSTVTFNPTSDSQIVRTGSPNQCTLSDVGTTTCIIPFKIKNISPVAEAASTIGSHTFFYVQFYSECNLLDTNSLTVEWAEADQDIMAEGYQLRDPAIQFDLPTWMPLLLSNSQNNPPSGSYTNSRCGSLTYTLHDIYTDAPNQPVWMTLTQPSSYDKGPTLNIETIDEYLILYEPDNTLIWKSRMRASYTSYPAVVIWTTDVLSFSVKDECIGWLISPANITTTDPASYMRFGPEFPDLAVEKYMFSGGSDFSFTKQIYYKQNYNSINEGCGVLEYTWTYWVLPPHSEMLVVSEDPLFFETFDAFNFGLFALDRDLMGHHYLTVSLSLSGLDLEPAKTFTVEIVIWDCLLHSLDWFSQSYEDVILHHYLEETAMELDFRIPLQVPDCGYEQWPTITVIEKSSL